MLETGLEFWNMVSANNGSIEGHIVNVKGNGLPNAED